MKVKKPSKNQLRRFPVYLSFLNERKTEGQDFISSPQIASSLNISEEQVRKDLNLVSSKSGKPKIGRNIEVLIEDIEEFLMNNEIDALGLLKSNNWLTPGSRIRIG